LSLGVALVCLLSLGVLAFLLLPIILGATVPVHAASAEKSELEDLYIQREGIYATLKELEFDFEASKLIEGDYHELRARYSAEAVELLKRIDDLEKATETKPRTQARGELSVAGRKHQKAGILRK